MNEEIIGGLSSGEAAARLKSGGYNELPQQRRQSFWRIFWEVIKEPMLAILVLAGIVYFLSREAMMRRASLSSVFPWSSVHSICRPPIHPEHHAVDAAPDPQ